MSSHATQGDTSPQSEPGAYLRSVQSLHAWYCHHAGSVANDGRSQCWPPLIVNTHGWVKGLGLDLLADILRCVRPSHVVRLQAGTDS